MRAKVCDNAVKQTVCPKDSKIQDNGNIRERNGAGFSYEFRAEVVDFASQKQAVHYAIAHVHFCFCYFGVPLGQPTQNPQKFKKIQAQFIPLW